MKHEVLFLRTGFNYDRAAASLECGLECADDSLTIQSQAKDADINVIMERYTKTGLMPPLARLPSFGDFDGISDYREAIHAVREADDLFMQLPAKVRSRFDNDPAEFAAFCSAPGNQLELAELGLLSEELTREIKEAAEVKENPTDGGTSEGGAAAAAGSDGDR